MLTNKLIRFQFVQQIHVSCATLIDLRLFFLCLQVLKPVVEKKRRDRINQSLAELKTLLFNHTCDPVSPAKSTTSGLCFITGIRSLH